MQTRQLMEIIYVLCTLYCTTIFGHSIEAVTKAEILPAVQKSVCVHTPTCQSVDSYRSHHMKPHTRQFWALANQHLRLCRQFLALVCCSCGLAGNLWLWHLLLLHVPTSHPLGSTSYWMIGSLAGAPATAQKYCHH